MRGLVLITYRDRLTHLDVIVPHMNKFFPELRLAICEQADKNIWNKGLLYNVGYKELAKDYDYIILHDIDFIPARNVDYSSCEVPTMIAGAASQFGYKLFYPGFFGGVIICSKEHYELVNGFSNQFKGYGGEDDHFRSSFVQKGIQPAVKMCRFECFEHPRPDIANTYKSHPHYQHNLRLLNKLRDFNDGLLTAEYKIIGRTDHNECIHLRIETNG